MVKSTLLEIEQKNYLLIQLLGRRNKHAPKDINRT